jgi:hypothetical protein
MLDHAAAADTGLWSRGLPREEARSRWNDSRRVQGQGRVLPLPVPVLRDLKEAGDEVVKGESENPMAKKVHASFTKFRRWWALGSRRRRPYHRLVAV